MLSTLKNLYINTVELSILIFLVLNVKLLYHKYILKDIDNTVEKDKKIINNTSDSNPWKTRTSYKISLDFNTLQGKFITLIGCFIPIINVLIAFMETCIIFSSEDINVNL